MKNGWQYVNDNGTTVKMAPLTLAENVLMSENGDSILGVIPSNPNLLSNGDLQVWQRGTSFSLTSDDAYTADGWAWLGSGTTSGTATKVPGGMQVISPKESNLYFRLMDEKSRSWFVGKTITVSISVNGNVFSNTFTFSSSGNCFFFNLDSSIWSYSPTSTNANVIVQLIHQTSSGNDLNVVINWIKVEIGSAATCLIPKDYDEELAKCQRRCLAVDTIHRIRGSLFTSGDIHFFVPTPVSMRADPIIYGNLSVVTTANAALSGFTFNAYVAANGLIVKAVKSSHGVNDATLVIPADAIFDADIR